MLSRPKYVRLGANAAYELCSETERVGTFPVEQLKYSTHMICYVSYIMCVCVCASSLSVCDLVCALLCGAVQQICYGSAL